MKRDYSPKKKNIHVLGSKTAEGVNLHLLRPLQVKYHSL